MSIPKHITAKWNEVLAMVATTVAVIEVAKEHNIVAGAILAGSAVGLSIGAISDTIQATFGLAKQEISQEIKPAEAGSPVREAPKPALNS